MAHLFQIIPPTLFRPLAAQGAPVYAEVLLRLFAETQRHQRPISRDLAVNIIAETLTSPEALEITSDAASDDTDRSSSSSKSDDPDDVIARSGAILRYLTSNGWLRIETQSDFSHAYTLPMHAFRLLSVLQDIADNESLQLQGVICAIHDLLQAAIRENTDTIRFQEAYRQTRFLLTSLKELQHNIGIHIQGVLEQLKARDVLEQIFTSYRSEIVDTAYHQLRTTDHVSRYRPAVLQALATLREEERLDVMAKQLRVRGDASTLSEAAVLLVDQIRIIREQFENLDQLLTAIDVRHSQFVDSAVRNIEHHLMASSTTSGQIYTILEHLITRETTPPGERLPAEYAPLLDLFSLHLFENESLAAPGRAAVPFEPETSDVETLAPEDREAAHNHTLEQLTRAVSRTRVRMYAEELLAGRDEIAAVDIPIDGPADLPLLIYLRAYGDGTLGYKVENPPAEEQAVWIERDGVGMRNFLLRRTEQTE
jgi:hypothetical protein